MSRRIPLTQGKFAVVDDDDYQRLTDMGSWCYDGHGYAVKNKYFLTGKRGHLQMHRVVNNTPAGKLTDHINGDRLDNRKANLRTVDGTGNALNKAGHRQASYRGYFKTPHGTYAVRFCNRPIGTFGDEGLACQIYSMLLSGELEPQLIRMAQGYEIKRGKYQVRVKHDGQRLGFGVFDTAEEASHVYNEIKEQLA